MKSLRSFLLDETELYHILETKISGLLCVFGREWKWPKFYRRESRAALAGRGQCPAHGCLGGFGPAWTERERRRGLGFGVIAE